MSMELLRAIHTAPLVLLRIFVVSVVIAGSWGCGPTRNHESSHRHFLASTDASAPTTAIDARTGAVYFSWFAQDDDGRAAVYVSTIQPGDSLASAPVRVDPHDVSVNPHAQAPAQIAVAPDGDVYVAWSTREEIDGRRFPASNLIITRSQDGGRSFEPPVFVNDDAHDAPSGHTFHDLAVAPDGTVYVSWLDSRVHQTPQRESRSTGGLASNTGQASSGSLDIGEGHVDDGRRSSTTGHHEHDIEHGDHIVGDGYTEESGTDVRVARSQDGGRTFSRGIIVAHNTCQCCRTAVVVDEQGSIHVAWRHIYDDNIRDIAFASSHDEGRTFSEPVRVHTDGWRIEGCPHSGPSLAVDDDGAIHISWYTAADSTAGLRYAVSSDGGRRFSAVRSLESDIPVAGAQLGGGDGDPVWVAWENPRADQICASVVDQAQDSTARPLTFAGSSPSIAFRTGVRSIVWQNEGGIEAYVSRRAAN